MPSCRPRWRACWQLMDIMRNMPPTSVCAMPRIRRGALRHQAVIITKDEDFPQRLSRSTTAPVIVWLRIGNTSRKALLEWFEPLLPRIVRHSEQGDRLIEVR